MKDYKASGIISIVSLVVLLSVVMFLFIGCNKQIASESSSTSVAENVNNTESEEDIVDEEYVETDISDFTIENGKLISYDGKESSIKIPTCVTEIDRFAFFKVKDIITEITIPSSVENIDVQALLCPGLKHINVQKSNRCYTSIDGVLFSKDLTKLLYYPLNRDGSAYTIPDTVTTICKSAFAGNGNIVEINIPESVTSIEMDAFFGSRKLEFVHLPSSLQEIASTAFSYCQSIQEIEIPDSVQKMGNGVFYHCENLKKIKIPKDIYTVPSNVFSQCYALEEVILHDKINKIESGAFSDCTILRKIEIQASVTEIEEGAFRNCFALKEVSIFDNVTIGPQAFYGVPWAYEHFPEFDITYNPVLNMDVLSGYYGKGGDVVIPEDVYYIAEPFDEIIADKITSLTFPNTIKNSTNIAMADDKLVNIANLYVHEDNQNFVSVDGVIYTKDMSTLVAFPNGRSGIFTIPNGVRKINGTAFSNCCKIEHLIIPDSVTTIEFQAFYNCESLKSVVLPAGITILGEAFQKCNNLKTIYYKGSEEQWKNIQKDEFAKNSNLENIKIVYNYELS